MPAWETADVVIVGGGPAGSAAAIALADAGVRAMVFERSVFPRDHPGETLHPGVEPLLDRLGVRRAVEAAGFIRHAGHSVEWGGTRTFVPFGRDADGPWLGYQAWRPTFDAILLDRAREAGAAVIQPCGALRPLTDAKGRVAGVTDGVRATRSRYVIDASGGARWLTRHLRLPRTPLSPRLIARYGYARGARAELSPGPLLAATSDGWTWTAQVRDALIHWCHLSLHSPSRAGTDPPALRQQLSFGPAVGRARGADVTWSMTTALAGPAYFIAGDAAVTLDPAASHGVMRALTSGIAAGSAAARVLGGVTRPAEESAAYSEWLRRWCECDARALRAIYATHPSLSRLLVSGASERHARAPPALDPVDQRVA